MYTCDIYSGSTNYADLITEGTLTDTLPIATKNFTVSIPASVGPPGFYYRLWVVSFSSHGVILPFPTYSNSFALSSANGTLTSYEVLGPVPNQFAAQGFYGGWSPPCSSYDCWRQCAKKDPPVFKDNGQGLAQAGQTFYDERYIKCLEACPDVKSPLPTDVVDVSTTTTGTGPLQTASPLITDVRANSSCDVAGGNTFCGEECCGVGVKCDLWNVCSTNTIDLDSSPEDGESRQSSTTSSAGSQKATISSVGSQKTSDPPKNGAGESLMPWTLLVVISFLQVLCT